MLCQPKFSNFLSRARNGMGNGWLADLVISSSGVAEPTVSLHTEVLASDIWYITRHEPEKFFVEMPVSPGKTARRLNVRFKKARDALPTSPTSTGLDPAGDEFVAKFTAEYYEKFMQAWEKELNHFLKTACRLPDDCAA
jgi:hypothetical protein